MPVQRFRARAERIRTLTHGVREITLQLLDQSGIVFEAGQYISFEVPHPRLNHPVPRQYSIASPPSRRQEVTLLLNLVPGGPGSSYLFSLKEGDEAQFTGPDGHFILRESTTRDLCFVATGTGIAPIRSMLLDLFDRGFPRPIALYWGLRSQRDLYYQDELTGLAARHANFSFLTTLSRPEPGWSGPAGRVTRLIEDRLVSVKNLAVYACGNGGMIGDVTTLVNKKGLCPVYREKYYDDAPGQEPD